MINRKLFPTIYKVTVLQCEPFTKRYLAHKGGHLCILLQQNEDLFSHLFQEAVIK